MENRKKHSSGSKRRRLCTSCGEKHLPPRGARCTNVPVAAFEPWDLEDGSESAGWATDAYSHGSPSRTTGNNTDLRAEKRPLIKAAQEPLRFSPPEWPALKLPWEKSAPARADDTGGRGEPIARAQSPTFLSGQRDPIQAQVDRLQHKMDEIAWTNRNSRDKMNNIEEMLSKALSGPKFDGVSGQISSPAPIGGARPKEFREHQNGGRSRAREKVKDNRRRSRRSERANYSSTDCSSSESCSSRDSLSRHKKSNKDHHGSPSKKRNTFKTSRFLPHDERERPMTTERLWFCHGSLMLELYDYGYDIRGLLEHNVFISEKAATRAYVSNGIIKYDEAVREKARDIGPAAYSCGDMGLALRFLSTEYARSRPSQVQNNSNQRSNSRRPGSVQNQINRDGGNRQAKVVCWAYNGSGCPYDHCRYPHACSRCQTPGHSQHNCRFSAGSSYSNVSPPNGS